MVSTADTTLHIVDPKNPGCVDEIIHLGDFWDEHRLRKHKKDIIAINHDIGLTFARAYRFLKAAKAVYDDIETCNVLCMDFGKANVLSEQVLIQVVGRSPVSSQVGRQRHLFASAITPEGMMNYLDTIIAPYDRRFIIEGEPGTGKSTLLKKIATSALERGYDVEMYHCPLNPEKVEHVFIPALGVALTKSIEPHRFHPAPDDKLVDMNACMNAELVKRFSQLTMENTAVFNMLFDRAIQFISEAKALHDRLETYYTAAMDFEGIEKLRKATLDRILRYAAEADVKVS